MKLFGLISPSLDRKVKASFNLPIAENIEPDGVFKYPTVILDCNVAPLIDNIPFISCNMLKILNYPTYNYTIPIFDDPKKEAFGKHYGKRRNAVNLHFLPFLKIFSTLYHLFHK